MSKTKPKLVHHAVKPSAAALNMIYGSQAVDNGPVVEQRWEELQEIYDQAANGLVTMASSVSEALTTPGITEHIDNLAETNLAVEGLNRDLRAFTDTLVQIHDRHKDKTGLITDPDDLALSLSVFEDYANFSVQFQAVTMPTVLTIVEQVGVAVTKVSKKADEAEQKTTEGSTDV